MATEVAAQRTRKLSVVDTLDHARRTLSTHRQWLKRRVSNDFGVIIEDGKDTAEDKDSQWTVADVEGEEAAQNVHTNPPSSPSFVYRAPPTFLPAFRVQKTASQFLKVGGDKVSPAPVLESLEEEKNIEPAVTGSQRVTWAVENNDTSSGKEGSPQEIPKSKRPKVKLVSRAAVSPATPKSLSDTQNDTDTNSSVPLHLFVSSHTSSAADVLPTPSSSPPHSPTPTHGSTLPAWGSLTSLDNYIESLQTVTHDEKQMEKTTNFPPKNAATLLQGSSSGESCASEHEKDSTEISQAAASSTNLTENVSLSSHPPTCGSIQSPAGVLPEDLPLNQAPLPPHQLSIDVAALQSRSSATILPVVPAPKDRQSSYEVHHQSTLEQVGKGLRVVEVKERAPSQEESGSQVRITPGKKVSVVSKNIVTSEALVEDVVPYKTEENETIVRSADVGSQQLQLGLSHCDVQKHTASLTSTTQPTVETREAATMADSCPDHMSPQPNTPAGGVGGGQELSFHPRLTSTPSVPLEREAKREEDSAQRKRQILEELQLPPLRENSNARGARSILSRLPRLKPQTPTSPTSPTNTGISTELRLSSKRSRELPSYTTHHGTMAGRALNPPCPQYGVKQPDDSNLQRKRLYSAPSHPQVQFSFPSPPSSPLHHKRMSIQPATIKRASFSSASHMSEQVDGGTTMPPPSPVRKQGSPLAMRQMKHTPVRHTVSTPAKQTAGADVGGEGGRRGSAALDSPLLRSQRKEDKESLDASGLRGSTGSLYHMHTGPGPLHLAAKSGNLRQMQSLMSEGHKVNERDHEGRTPLMYCIHSRGVHLSCASLLIQGGADLDKQASDGSTAIHLASAVGAISLIEFALLNHADPDIRDFEGRLPLHWVTLSSHSSKCAALLLKHSRLDINAVDDAGMTSLMWAAYNNNPVVTAFLLSQGADCEEKDMDGMTAMHWAVHQEGVKCLELLLKADHTYFKDHKGRTVLHVAAEVGCTGGCELVLQLRADAVHDLDRMGRTPLHYAAACSRVDVCALLLDRGSDASQRDLLGKTAIEYARQKRFDYVVALLTCHETSVADFAKASRSTSVSSLLNRATSFSQLPISGEAPANQDIITESLQPPLPNETSDNGLATTDSSRLYTGTFLGRFVQDKNDPLQHFFFWLTEEGSLLHWSRERDQRKPQEASVYEVHAGPSKLLQQNSAYSPDELHQHVFWVMTDRGVLDLLAYNGSAYQMWVSGLRNIAQGAPEGTSGGSAEENIMPGGSQIGPQRKISLQTEQKKTFRLKTKRSTAIAPALVIENEASDSHSVLNSSRASLWSHSSGQVSCSERELDDTSVGASKSTKINQPAQSQESPQGNGDISIDDII